MECDMVLDDDEEGIKKVIIIKITLIWINLGV